MLLLTIAGLWAAVLALYFARSFNGMLATVILYAFFIGPIVPLVDNAVLTLLGDHKAGYGRDAAAMGQPRLGLAASLLGPVLERAGLGWAVLRLPGLHGAINFVVAARLPMHISGDGARLAYRAGLRPVSQRPLSLLLLACWSFGLTLGVLLSYQFPSFWTNWGPGGRSWSGR